MAAETGSSRLEAVAEWLAGAGMPRESASSLSSLLVLRHPLTHRIGVRALARRLGAEGLRPDAADDAAALLFALEGLEMRHAFGRVLADLRAAGYPQAAALAAGLEAARLHRSTAPIVPDRLPLLLGLAPLVLAVVASCLAVWLVR